MSGAGGCAPSRSAAPRATPCCRQVPTFAEAGLPDFTSGSWHSLVGPQSDAGLRWPRQVGQNAAHHIARPHHCPAPFRHRLHGGGDGRRHPDSIPSPPTWHAGAKWCGPRGLERGWLNPGRAILISMHDRRWVLIGMTAIAGSLAGCAARRRRRRRRGRKSAYSYLPQIRLNVARVDIDERNPNAGPTDAGRLLRPSAAEAVRIMGRDRVSAFGTEGVARFVVTRAAILQERLPRQRRPLHRRPRRAAGLHPGLPARNPG